MDYIYDSLNKCYSATPKPDEKDRIDLVVGDDKTTDRFYPQVKIMRWDNEVNFSARLVEPTAGTRSVTKVGNEIVWKRGNKIEAHFYDIPISEDRPEGGHEFEIILKSKPTTNKIEFTLNTKGVDFFYQPSLTQEEIGRGASRPENVVGSYAVYHSTKGGMNDINGKDYKVGKVGHIFRPKIIDSAGTEVWGDLHIENGILSVTIPQEFLDKAVYPVRHAAGLTFGYTSNGQSENGSWNNYVVTHGDTYTGTAGTGTSMSAYVRRSVFGTYSLQMALYDASNNYVTNGKTESVTVSGTTKTWYTANFVSAPTITASEYYLVLNNNLTAGTDRYSYDVAGTTNYKFAAQAFNIWPASISWTNASSKYQYSIYATYTAAESNPTVNVYDSVTVTETVIPLKSALDINVHDDLTVAETTTSKIPILHINAHDDITTAETTTVASPSSNALSVNISQKIRIQ